MIPQWKITEPPKDRLIVAIGQIIMPYGNGHTAVRGFTSLVKFHPESGHWVDEEDMTIQTQDTDTVSIFWWSEVPPGLAQAITAAAKEAKEVA